MFPMTYVWVMTSDIRFHIGFSPVIQHEKLLLKKIIFKNLLLAFRTRRSSPRCSADIAPEMPP